MDESVRARLLAAGPDHEIPVPLDAHARPIPDPVIEQAVTWYAQLASGVATDQDRAAFARWRDAQPDHALAWARLQNMGQRLQDSKARVAPAVTQATLTRLAALSNRRQALKRLAWMGAAGAGLYLAQDQWAWRSQLAAALADEHTAVGQRRHLMLADGTRLSLNTDTAVDIRFNAHQRRIVLRNGEILVSTGKDRMHRPLVVITDDGELVPMGTRFTVRRDADDSGPAVTRLAVTEGAVEVRPAAAAAAQRIHAGQQVSFTREAIDTPMAVQPERLAWIQDAFAAESMRLQAFLAELSRYRTGRLRCAPAVADLRITGVWPLDGPQATERILDALERRLPVRVQRYTRYWITVAGR
ncbi:FecR domain-containing protein [Bordetella genomosp. 12]|uniref:Iron dicitrate transport regulator FecR n=1 Tax=Bordetella genomosp. 12 TaxID=463035 RepID=A0A261VW04_9BORD|nr:FecR domain-containing protein [Bordetella genomosp. 12]OZI77682.1 hypothetical protein CAL22_03895 [Bordetella genomosp. 12]